MKMPKFSLIRLTARKKGYGKNKQLDEKGWGDGKKAGQIFKAFTIRVERRQPRIGKG